MYRQLLQICLVLVLVSGLIGCDSSRSPTAPSLPPAGPQATPPIVPPATVSLVTFTERGSGFSTTDVRDARDQIVQFNTAGELIWTADGSRLPGYRVDACCYPGVSFIVGSSCAEGCALEVRFGTKDGERRAYLTADYGHDNPGTLVELAIVGDVIRATRTSTFPPGTPTLTGVVTEMTEAGPIPVEGVKVYRGVVSGWRDGITDKDGFYEIRGLLNDTEIIVVKKDGYVDERRTVTIDGDTTFDTRLVRR